MTIQYILLPVIPIKKSSHTHELTLNSELFQFCTTPILVRLYAVLHFKSEFEAGAKSPIWNSLVKSKTFSIFLFLPLSPYSFHLILSLFLSL